MKRLIAIWILSVLAANCTFSQNGIPLNNNSPEEKYSKLRLSIKGGAGFLVASSKNAEESMASTGMAKDDAKAYYRNLKSGIGCNADITYLLDAKYGLGLKYKYFHTSAAIEGFIDPQDGITMLYGGFNERIHVNYVGITALIQEFARKDKLRFNTSYSLGLVTYRNEAEYVGSFYLFQGKNLGFDLGLEAEYMVNKNISIVADASVFYSSLKKMKISDGTSSTSIDLDKDSRENLSRIDISLGIIFYLPKK
jgi:hypothetical protein